MNFIERFHIATCTKGSKEPKTYIRDIFHKVRGFISKTGSLKKYINICIWSPGWVSSRLTKLFFLPCLFHISYKIRMVSTSREEFKL